MGCCSSSEVSQDPPEERAGNAISQNNGQAPSASAPRTQSSAIYSPSSSRAPLTGSDAHGSTSRPSAAHSGQRGTTRQSSSPDANLSSHYNAPLVAPKPWKSTSRTWSRAQLEKERQDFFDTRVAGRREIWEALRQVSECIRDNDLTTAQGILDAVNVTLPTGRLEDGAYDERGELYKVSHAVLKDPSNIVASSGEEEDGDTMVGVQAESKGIEDDKLTGPVGVSTLVVVTDSDKGKSAADDDAIKIKCRASNSGNDTIITLGKSQPISVLQSRLSEELAIKSSHKVRIFYLGRELEKKKTLEDQGYVEGHVLNIFVSAATG